MTRRNMFLPDDIWDHLNYLAGRENISVASLIRRILSNWLLNQPRPAKAD